LGNSDENKDAVEIWGGLEYSYVRVKNNVYDQLARTGYEKSTIDIELFSELNIKTIRYPLLLEKYENDSKSFFRVNDHRLNKLMEHGIKPIAGLLHHGSGPFKSSLYENDFPALLAEYAYRIAERYPWLELYTPVNEPLTTARFSGLYGIWYPHMNNDQAFLKMFINELKGTVLSMQAAKSINPGAKLIQTEDISKIHSLPSLQYQADFENERRWMTYDILSGKFGPSHPLWKYVIDSGIKEIDMEFFLQNICEPHVMGFNYYATSERYLDTHKNIYPACYHGGNSFEDYADVEAVRANIPVTISPGKLLKEAWARYHRPVALTEVHLACTREEQLRWFNEAYQNALSLKKDGVDIRAITAWSFFGSFDWSTLLCQRNDHYEPGVYDIRSGIPRATAIAGLIKSINRPDRITANLLQTPGWWRREDRFIYKPEGEKLMLEKENTHNHKDISPLLIIGAKGSLGSAIARICDVRGIKYYLSGRSELDIASEESVKDMLEDLNPWGIINAAGYTRIDEAENAAFTCFRENTIGPVILAEACRRMGIKFVTFSSDQVFNGKKKKPYTEQDSTQPLNFYGLSKKFAEEKVLRINPDTLIIRSGSFFNPWYSEDNLGKLLLSGTYSDQRYPLATDIIYSPAYVPDLVNTVLDLMIDQESGIWHLSSQEEISYFDFTRKALQIAGLNESIVIPVPAASLNYAATRPDYSVLKSSAGLTLPLLSHSLNGFISEFFKEPINQLVNQPSL
jgi:dTDP-4-dehydrorhamnose reductase